MPRKAFAGNKLAFDAARLLADDVASPPEAKPNLMDAVRELTAFIEVRSDLGWTDPMIARLLTEAGYPISAGTLCSYRKRLRDERAITPAGTTDSVLAKTPTASVPTAATPRPGKPDVAAKAVNGSSIEPIPLQPLNGVPKPSTADRPRSRTFTVSGPNLPPARA